MSTVWVVKEQALRGELGPVVMNYSAAMEYGELKFITRHDLPVHMKSDYAAKWSNQVMNFVDEYNEYSDYIITTGQPLAIFAVGWVLGLSGKIPRFLVWRREEGRYHVANFDAIPFINALT